MPTSYRIEWPRALHRIHQRLFRRLNGMTSAFLVVAAALTGCEQAEQATAPLYDSVAVEAVDIEVSVEAAGVIEPETTVEVKSKASGEILAVHADTGDVVEEGTLLVEVDERTPRNRLAEAEAALVATRARRTIAGTQMQRSETLFASGTLTQTEFEQTQLEFANAEAQVVSDEVAVENARIAMEDTDVRAPISGTIIEKAVEPGIVISSPTNNVSGGTVLMQMANLNAVQVRTLVDETDIGKIQPGLSATVTVAAYPNQPFSGEVLKIEPLAIVEQNVTMFAVLIRLDNRNGLLKPGMNAEVSIEIARRSSVPAVPTAALRANDDIPATAVMLGMPESTLRALLAGTPVPEPGAGAISYLEVAGRRIELPPGVSARDVEALVQKRRSGAALTAVEADMLRPLLGQLFAERGSTSGASGFSGGGGRSAGAAATEYQFGGNYWVVAVRSGELLPLQVKTGLTDLANSEIIAGLELGDQVMLLPSTSLFEQQVRLQDYISERFSSTPFQQNSGGNGRRDRFFR